MSAESNIDNATPEPEPGATSPEGEGAVPESVHTGEGTEAVTGEASAAAASAREVPPISDDEEAALREAARLLANGITDSGPPAPTESYIHPVTGREVYVPKVANNLGPSALISTMALLMFVGGALATMMMVARAFDLHGQTLIYFVIATCAGVLGLAGGLLLKTQGHKWWVGVVIGACFGTIAAILVYAQTSHHSWWR